MLASPTTKDFTNVMMFLFRQFDPVLPKTFKLEEEVRPETLFCCRGSAEPDVEPRWEAARLCDCGGQVLWRVTGGWHSPPCSMRCCPAAPACWLQVPQLYKRLKYPFQISKSNLTAVGSPHTWPSLLVRCAGTGRHWVPLLRGDGAALGAVAARGRGGTGGRCCA